MIMKNNYCNADYKKYIIGSSVYKYSGPEFMTWSSLRLQKRKGEEKLIRKGKYSVFEI